MIRVIKRKVHCRDCACEKCCRYRDLERADNELASEQIAAKPRGPFPWVTYTSEVPSPTPPKEYRRSHDGTLKPVVSKGCRGCHQKTK